MTTYMDSNRMMWRKYQVVFNTTKPTQEGVEDCEMSIDMWAVNKEHAIQMLNDMAMGCVINQVEGVY